MLDYVVRGGRVVTPWGVGAWDVAIQGEKIVAVAEPNTLTGDIGRVIDATGNIVIPGGIEPHAHVAAPIMGFPGMETAPPDQVSRAALFGGTTTLVDFAIQRPGIDIFKALDERHGRWKGQSYADYSYHCMLLAEIPTPVISQIKSAIEAGFPSFKIFTTNIRPITRTEPRMVGMGYLSAVMEQVAANGGLMAIHSEDDDIVQFMYKKLTEENRTEWYNMHLVHNNMSEDVSFRRVIRVAEWTGAAVYFVHVSAKEGVKAIQEARGKGLPIYGETLHNYVSFSADDYKQEDGMKYHTYPSLKSQEDRLALWDGLLRNDLQTMATDEYCTTFAFKLQGKKIDDVTGGHNGAETRVGITYNEGVVKRGMSLQRFVDVVSSNAARLLGLYPRKGAIAPGSDADIVFIDPRLNKRLSMADLHISDYSIWEGWDIRGWPVFTMLRGKVMIEGGKLVGKQGDGQLIPRKIDAAVLSRPGC
ncbi:MAG: amidohydrolase family protein [Nitrospinae bacterium]|nr:amidohydrolase family protein [Nitrospinota bacterium]